MLIDSNMHVRSIVANLVSLKKKVLVKLKAIYFHACTRWTEFWLKGYNNCTLNNYFVQISNYGAIDTEKIVLF